MPSDAQNPRAGLVLDSSGNLHGTSVNGGGTGCGGTGCGTVFGIPIRTPFSVLHNFTGGRDGATPYAGLTKDAAGNLYGTTSSGNLGPGTVFKLTKLNGAWTFNSLYNFIGGSDGGDPLTRVVFGPNGILYGTTNQGGTFGGGTVFKLQPPATFCRSVSCPWTKTTFYEFGQSGSNDGRYPDGEFIFDQTGNIYAVTQQGGTTGYGAVYELALSHGVYLESVLYSFDRNNRQEAYPGGILARDASGNLYGIG